MPSNQTPNYQLSQWEAADQVLREDFNADNAKIDTALTEKVNIITGTYAGDEAASRFISLGVTPRALLLFTESGASHSSSAAYGGLALPGYSVRSGSAVACEIVDNGFMVYYKRGFAGCNDSFTFHYLALV